MPWAPLSGNGTSPGPPSAGASSPTTFYPSVPTRKSSDLMQRLRPSRRLRATAFELWVVNDRLDSPGLCQLTATLDAQTIWQGEVTPVRMDAPWSEKSTGRIQANGWRCTWSGQTWMLTMTMISLGFPPVLGNFPPYTWLRRWVKHWVLRW